MGKCTGRHRFHYGKKNMDKLEKNSLSTTTLLQFLGGVYMTPGRLSPRSEFTPVPSHGSIFVYMIPPQNVMPARVTPA